MALQNLPPVTFQAELNLIYNLDQEIRDNIRGQYGLENLSLTREEFQEAIDGLAALGVALVSASYIDQTNGFIDAFNSYQTYMNA